MAPDPMQANFQPYPRLDQVQPDPMYPMQPELLGSPLTPQPPPLQPMWVPGPQMAAMTQQVPFRRSQSGKNGIFSESNPDG